MAKTNKEAVDRLEAVIYSSVVEINGNCVEQIRYSTQNNYEEVEAMIEEAMM